MKIMVSLRELYAKRYVLAIFSQFTFNPEGFGVVKETASERDIRTPSYAEATIKLH
ncbi:MAG: hypothetical protein QXJ75_01185 [Candidatus Bathyarchaeia archaeon]